ncbi:acyl carrier protein [Anthocerotibacter panamensis]|uniref:acyl carrier protein n=1 Tax=Anthocerotibacter panamensis TaxID=2857077 RepID=UPI001C4070A9|nr:acyl carrier protein [Anthocerotibacter panamensis]
MEPDTQQVETAAAIQDWLVQNLAEQLGCDPATINVNESFENYGMDSAQALALIAKAEKVLGFRLSPLLIFHYPTITLLSERLAEDQQSTEVTETVDV